MKEKRLYVAYGSNLNKLQMSQRCPDAVAYGTAVLEDLQLMFRGSCSGFYLTLDRKPGAGTPVALWEVSAADERSLDRYEGCPRFYYKTELELPVKNLRTGETETVTGFVYLLPEEKTAGMPTRQYMETCSEGYRDFGFDTAALQETYHRTAADCGYSERI